MSVLPKVSRVIALVLTLSAPRLADAQGKSDAAIRVTPLGASVGSLNEEFSRLISVRELSSGKVLLTDDKDIRIAVGDFKTGNVRTLGRSGDGPTEYRAIGRLWDIGGDSTFMSVPYAARWLVLHRDSIVGTYTGQLPVILKVGPTIIRGADAKGNVIGIARALRQKDKPYVMPDSFRYVRTHRTSLRSDTVFSEANAFRSMKSSPMAAGGKPVPPDEQMYSIELAARDQVAMFPDGAIAVLRGSPFRVDWCMSGAKQCTSGPALERTDRNWSDADTRAYLKSMNALAAWPPTNNVDQVSGWPERNVPFATPGGPDEANFWATPSGNVVLERVPNSERPLIMYDVMDRAGKLVARVSVPPGHRVVGFGQKTAYVVRVDEDQVQHLQRHAWAY